MKKSNNKLLCLVVLIIILMIICCLRKNEKFFTLGDTSCNLVTDPNKKEKCNGLVDRRKDLIRIRSEIMSNPNHSTMRVKSLNRQIDLISMAIAKLTPADKQGEGEQVFRKPFNTLIQYKPNRNYKPLNKCEGRSQLGCVVHNEQGGTCMWAEKPGQRGKCVRAPSLYKDRTVPL